MRILQHLENLTDYFLSPTNERIPYINIYSRPSGKKFLPVYAKGEGKSCVDDVARACVLAFEIFEFTQDLKALERGLNWIKFLDYMTTDDGLIYNFIDLHNKRVDHIKSSYPGGAWWTARAKHAYAKAYKVTKDNQHLKKYFRLNIRENFDTDVASLLFLAGFEIKNKEDKRYLHKLAKEIYKNISPQKYMVHHKNHNEIHLWGYHQLEASTKAYDLFKEKRFLDRLNKTKEIVVQDAIKNNFYYSYPSRIKDGLCAYCISPIARGLFEAYNITRDEKYKAMFLKCTEWFYGKNEFKKIMYNKLTGACLDGIKKGKLSRDCGAESSIEAGYVELRRLILQET